MQERVILSGGQGRNKISQIRSSEVEESLEKWTQKCLVLLQYKIEDFYPEEWKGQGIGETGRTIPSTTSSKGGTFFWKQELDVQRAIETTMVRWWDPKRSQRMSPSLRVPCPFLGPYLTPSSAPWHSHYSTNHWGRNSKKKVRQQYEDWIVSVIDISVLEEASNLSFEKMSEMAKEK